jgi:hypothetical protein
MIEPCDVAEMLTRRLGRRPGVIDLLRGGRNNRIYRVLFEDGETAVMKLALRPTKEGLSRTWVEFHALELLRRHDVTAIPAPLHLCAEEEWALYTCIAGAPAGSGPADSLQVDECVNFLRDLDQLARYEDFVAFPCASEACLTMPEYEHSVENRFRVLRASEQADAIGAEMRDFLQERFQPAWERVKVLNQAEMGSAFEASLSRDERTLSPSDFGLHNAIRTPEGTLVFLDFEYFGWDDPAKTISDFLLHPAMTLDEPLKRRFLEAMMGAYERHERLRLRLPVVFRCLALKWCLIVLNEFLADGLEMRRFSGDARVRDAILETQLQKARMMLDTFEDAKDAFPYDNVL